MKKTFLVFVLLFVSVSLFSAAVSSSKVNEAASNMLYYKMDFWGGAKLISDNNPAGYQINSNELGILLSKAPEAYRTYQESNSKLLLGDIILLGSMIGGLGCTYLSAYDYNSYYGVNYALLTVGLLAVCVGSFAGGLIINDSRNLFFQSIHEYNKAMITIGITDNGGVNVQKSVAF